MTALDNLCDICGYPPVAGVAAVPAFPISLAWCPTCLRVGVMPMFCVEVTLCDGDDDLRTTVQRHGAATVKALAADWFLEQATWVPPVEGIGPGRYLIIGWYIDSLSENKSADDECSR